MRQILPGSGAPGIASVVTALLLATGSVRGATTSYVALDASPDVTVVLSGTTVDDEDVANDDGTPAVMRVPLGALPASADLDGYHLRPSGDVLFSLDTTVALAGGPTAGPADVVRYDGASYAIEFSAASAGVPAGADVDAVSEVGADGLLLSFDTTVDLGGIVADDEDLVLWDGTGFALFLDGSAAGLSGSLDLDGAHHVDANGNLLVSLDGSGTVGGVFFDDEDVLEYDPATGSWELAFDGSGLHVDWLAADLDAAFSYTDVDQDAEPDRSDVCPYVSDDQSDTDGNGIGDACQCGDVDADGNTNTADAFLIARGQVSSGSPHFGKCDVSGDGRCDTADAFMIARGQVSSDPAAQRCPAYGAP